MWVSDFGTGVLGLVSSHCAMCSLSKFVMYRILAVHIWFCLVYVNLETLAIVVQCVYVWSFLLSAFSYHVWTCYRKSCLCFQWQHFLILCEYGTGNHNVWCWIDAYPCVEFFACTTGARRWRARTIKWHGSRRTWRDGKWHEASCCRGHRQSHAHSRLTTHTYPHTLTYLIRWVHIQIFAGTHTCMPAHAYFYTAVHARLYMGTGVVVYAMRTPTYTHPIECTSEVTQYSPLWDQNRI